MPKFAINLVNEVFPPTKAKIIIENFALYYLPRWSVVSDGEIIDMAHNVLSFEAERN